MDEDMIQLQERSRNMKRHHGGLVPQRSLHLQYFSLLVQVSVSVVLKGENHGCFDHLSGWMILFMLTHGGRTFV